MLPRTLLRSRLTIGHKLLLELLTSLLLRDCHRRLDDVATEVSLSTGAADDAVFGACA